MASGYFRIVRSDPPTVDDFLSDKARGFPPRNDEPMTLRVWDGISVYRTATQARNKARDYPFLGHFIAELSIPDDAAIGVEKTYGRGHHTVWGAAETLLSMVVSVTPVEVVE